MYLIGTPVEPELLEEFRFCSSNKTSIFCYWLHKKWCFYTMY